MRILQGLAVSLRKEKAASAALRRAGRRPLQRIHGHRAVDRPKSRFRRLEPLGGDSKREELLESRATLYSRLNWIKLLIFASSFMGNFFTIVTQSWATKQRFWHFPPLVVVIGDWYENDGILRTEYPIDGTYDTGVHQIAGVLLIAYLPQFLRSETFSFFSRSLR
jgi:hypothetical protein